MQLSTLLEGYRTVTLHGHLKDKLVTYITRKLEPSLDQLLAVHITWRFGGSSVHITLFGGSYDTVWRFV